LNPGIFQVVFRLTQTVDCVAKTNKKKGGRPKNIGNTNNRLHLLMVGEKFLASVVDPALLAGEHGLQGMALHHVPVHLLRITMSKVSSSVPDPDPYDPYLFQASRIRI
jgi:hypothetical protein